MCVCVREKVRSASLVYEHYHWFLVWIMCRFFFLLADLTPIQAARRNRNSVNVHLTDTKAIDWNI